MYRCAWNYTVTIIPLIFFHIICPSVGGLFRVFLDIVWPMFLYFLRTFQFFLMKFCRLCYWYYCDGHYTKEISFSFMPLCWGSFWGIYEPIFFISWEPFNICTYVFGVTVTVTTLIFFYIISLSLDDHFWGIFWPF